MRIAAVQIHGSEALLQAVRLFKSTIAYSNPRSPIQIRGSEALLQAVRPERFHESNRIAIELVGSSYKLVQLSYSATFRVCLQSQYVKNVYKKSPPWLKGKS